MKRAAIIALAGLAGLAPSASASPVRLTAKEAHRAAVVALTDKFDMLSGERGWTSFAAYHCRTKGTRGTCRARAVSDLTACTMLVHVHERRTGYNIWVTELSCHD